MHILFQFYKIEGQNLVYPNNTSLNKQCYSDFRSLVNHYDIIDWVYTEGTDFIDAPRDTVAALITI